MNEDALFKVLSRQNKDTLLELLRLAYEELSSRQKRYIFGDLLKESQPSTVSAPNVIQESEEFFKDSLDGVYYAYFEINSKNFSHIPEETEEWFEKLGELLEASAQLTRQKEHQAAVDSFKILYELIAKMENGDDIIFADAFGSWMIPGQERDFLDAYIASLSEVKTPEEYARIVTPLIERDSYSSFCNKVHELALKHGNEEQAESLMEAIKEQNIKIK
ncbi:MAG: hypothetical protein GC158_09965 [Cyanobacteria bacterium RI_101]|nr:hypothetical protein [Cyanobacteria bacterium RI_101]